MASGQIYRCFAACTRVIERFTWSVCFLVSAVWAGPGLADERIALVIGNSAYGTVSALDNPSNDARLIADKLGSMGFDVTMLTDSNQIEMKRAISQFGRDLRQGGEDAVGLFYYAGHGVQSFGSNYLLPVDVSLNDPADLDLMAVEARSVLHQMASARNKTNIVILDACRNNPFEELADMDDNGLAEMKAPTGTFLAYATDPGGVALDGENGNSPFTLSLAQHMSNPGVPIEQVFKSVRVDVLDQSRGQQTPWDTSSLTQNFEFVPAVSKTPVPEFQSEEDAWQAAVDSGDPVQIMLFTRAFPDSVHADDAKELLKTAMAEAFGSATPAEPPARPQPEPSQGPAPVASENESLMYDLAKSDNTILSYEVYLQSFPNGAFAQQASEQLAMLRTESQTVTRKAEAGSTAALETPAGEAIRLGTRLTLGSEFVRDKTILELIAGSPQFPPIDGLPEELWKDQQCSNCHQWTGDTLCDQAQTYLKRAPSTILAKQHPYGGGLKVNLRSWAQGGCLQ